ncbi:hypothetical protein V565_326440 [Rhizoctonia solani 123E]|uniref:Uncharacterized protein n=2 Tax=Rhizoctonia solani AG-3 TaxID=1086053 RepID=A0A074RE07_9AGAM|nr:hypothetical protein V565_326440 [Rhizoctonia solani 123E]
MLLVVERGGRCRERESGDVKGSVPTSLERLRPDPTEEDIRRTIQEWLISGLLTVKRDHDTVDWDERWDPDGGDDEERWFDEEEESWGEWYE